MRPIVLTELGETLTRVGNGDSKTDKDRISVEPPLFAVGVHEHCDGLFDMRPVSLTHKALVCDTCNLRIALPVGIKTYGQLRQHLKRHQ